MPVMKTALFLASPNLSRPLYRLLSCGLGVVELDSFVKHSLGVLPVLEIVSCF